MCKPVAVERKRKQKQTEQQKGVELEEAVLSELAGTCSVVAQNPVHAATWLPGTGHSSSLPFQAQCVSVPQSSARTGAEEEEDDAACMLLGKARRMHLHEMQMPLGRHPAWSS